MFYFMFISSDFSVISDDWAQWRFFLLQICSYCFEVAETPIVLQLFLYWAKKWGSLFFIKMFSYKRVMYLYNNTETDLKESIPTSWQSKQHRDINKPCECYARTHGWRYLFLHFSGFRPYTIYGIDKEWYLYSGTGN